MTTECGQTVNQRCCSIVVNTVINRGNLVTRPRMTGNPPEHILCVSETRVFETVSRVMFDA